MQQKELNFPENGMQFSEFDREFGEFLLRQSGNSSPGLLYAGMLIAFELRAGQCSLELAEYAGKSLLCSSGQVIRIPEYDSWYAELTAPGNREIIAPEYSPDGRSLLVMPRPGKLMLRRYADFENCIREALFSRRKFADVPEFFQTEVNAIPDLQDMAVFTGINSRLLILSGGPGTGKTTVCGRILAELLRRDPGKKIFFAAPTGKAQKRMAEQIKESAAAYPEDSPLRKAMELIPGATVHSFVYNPRLQQELAFCQLLLLDECSMIPLELFANILKLLPPEASIILCGDFRQLTSVDSGSVFGDLCRCGKANLLPVQGAELFNSRNGNAGCAVEGDGFSGFIVELQKNYRSASAPAICRVSASLRDFHPGNAPEYASQLAALNEADFQCRQIGEDKLTEALAEQVNKPRFNGYSLADLPQLCSSGDETLIAAGLKLAEKFKLICAVRKGDFGVEAVNFAVMRALNILPENNLALLPGTILMITVNDRRTGLRNGDIGVVIKRNTVAEVCFPGYDGKCVPLIELPEYEYGFAITIHKAQGSGYDDVTLILPDHASEVLGIELLYTGISRAAKHLEMWANPEILQFCLERHRERSSNLFLCS